MTHLERFYAGELDGESEEAWWDHWFTNHGGSTAETFKGTVYSCWVVGREEEIYHVWAYANTSFDEGYAFLEKTQVAFLKLTGDWEKTNI